MLRSLPSTIDDALDTLYELNAVFSQFLGSASMTFFFSYSPFLASSSCLVSPCFSCLFSSFLSFLVFSLHCLFFPFLYLLLFSLFLFPIDLRLSCVCVVIGTTCNIYVVVSLGWQRYIRFFQAPVVRRMHQYEPGTS